MTLKVRHRFQIVVGVCLLLSLGWLGTCVLLGDSKHAGLGGDLAAAISLVALFINANILESLKGPNANIEEGLAALNIKAIAGETTADLAERTRAGVEKLFRKLVEDSDNKARENNALAIATAVAVLIGAFGEIIAEYLLKL